jgi:hypothetical protein
MMGISLQDGKSAYGKTSEPFHRQRGSQEFSEEKELKNQGHRSSPGERSQKCYGCGHVTTPPHRKKDCPHKERSGWDAPTVMTKPLLLVAMSCENVAIFEVFIEGLGAKVGLDSMSSSSLISSQLVGRLPVRRYKGPRLLLSPAGDGRAIEIEEFVKVSVGGLGPQELILEMGIASLPVDAIIGWSDIRNQGLVSLLFDAAAIQIPSLREFAPEEYEEEDEEKVVADKLTNEILSKWRIEFPEVFSGKLSSVPAELEGMEIILKEGASFRLAPLCKRKWAILSLSLFFEDDPQAVSSEQISFASSKESDQQSFEMEPIVWCTRPEEHRPAHQVSGGHLGDGSSVAVSAPRETSSNYSNLPIHSAPPHWFGVSVLLIPLTQSSIGSTTSCFSARRQEMKEK